MSFLQRFSGSLYWRLSLLFMLILSVMAGIFLYVSITTADMYYQEATYKLNTTLADHIARFNQPFVQGEVNKEELDKTFHNVMVYNPSTEVYLVDTEGKILSYYAPASKVKLESINLKPVKAYIESAGADFLQGDDPRNPGEIKAFSAAPVWEGETLQGYIYVVLASEEYASIADRIQGSYYLRLGWQWILLTFLVSGILGILLIRLLTQNLQKIVKMVRQFQQGNHQARVKLQSRGELTQLADDINEMADSIVRYIREIQSVEELRRELIANVSHDLRTPLAAIQGYAETLVLKSKDLPEADREKYIEIILKSTNRVNKLVQDLFELSKLETNQIEPQFERFSLAELVADIVAKYGLMAKSQGVRLDSNIPHDLPDIHADLALIDRVLQNLVDNALKYTPENGVIAIEIQSTEKGLQVNVADTGLGIPEGELPFIFNRYRQGTKPKKGGAGLGLAIVKRILDLHEATLSVSSKENEGTVFTFVLPTA
ncbi:HAMP domain-containing protein [bacterium SCSIO 12741]|nr:HAMP domain-containing protein [bacterium SCSIO 12741]